MGGYGGMTPYPNRYGGGRPRVQVILDSLNADRGTAYDASNRETSVYVENMAIARAISAAWGTNARLGNLWIPSTWTSDILGRWEKILALSPAPTDTEQVRRERVAALFAGVGQAAISGYFYTLLSEALGSAFVGIEYIPYASATITVPDGTYPFGTPSTTSPWSSSVAHVLVRLQKPSGWAEGEFYAAAAKVVPILDPALPAWSTCDWYRAGPISVVVGTLTAAGFYLDDISNLDNEIFDV